MARHIIAAFALLIASLAAPAVHAQDDASAAVLRIGTKVSEPFVIKSDDGSLDGLSIRLWKSIASELGLQYEFVELELDAILDGVASSELDAGIAAISVTPEREERADFTNTYFMGGLAIAVSRDGSGVGFLRGLRGLLTPGFWLAVGSLSLVLLIVGVLAWLFERRRNSEQFGGGVVRGIGNGFWFSAVTMTTVGYGDKAPQTPPGRLLGLVWMFASIIIISTFTGTIASSITAASLEAAIRGPEDLRTARVGVIRSTQAESAMRARGISPSSYGSVDDGLASLADGDIDAFVHDGAILSYAISERFNDGARLLDSRFDLRPYAIALPEGSELREPLNLQLLEVTGSDQWRSDLQRFVPEP